MLAWKWAQGVLRIGAVLRFEHGELVVRICRPDKLLVLDRDLHLLDNLLLFLLLDAGQIVTRVAVTLLLHLHLENLPLIWDVYLAKVLDWVNDLRRWLLLIVYHILLSVELRRRAASLDLGYLLDVCFDRWLLLPLTEWDRHLSPINLVVQLLLLHGQIGVQLCLAGHWRRRWCPLLYRF